MRKLDTRSLEIFAAVAACLNFRQAAELLHMTQPPLSRAVRQLEQRLGVRLFERDTQHVALTPAGQRLLPLANQVLGLLDLAEGAMRAAASGGRREGALRLGLTTSVESGLFRPYAEALAATPQGARLELVFAPSPRLVASLRAGRLDAAIIALPTRSFELEVRPLCQQPMLAALPSSHPLARRRSVALRELNGDAVYWFDRARQPAYFDHCHAVFRLHGFAPAFLREPEDHHVLLGDVAAGKGVALLPASFAALRRAGVVYRKLAEGDALAVGLGLALPGAGATSTHPALPMLAALAGKMLGDGLQDSPERRKIRTSA
jgi:DNA-binding transcriptional LysR family regulator